MYKGFPYYQGLPSWAMNFLNMVDLSTISKVNVGKYAIDPMGYAFTCPKN